jgi:hypothetical protein
MPGRLSVVNGKTTFILLFSKNKELMNLDEWLDQIFFKEKITIRELIKSVANKEAAHADINYNKTLTHCKSWLYNDVECHIFGIYGITRFIKDLVEIEYKSFLN